MRKLLMILTSILVLSAACPLSVAQAQDTNDTSTFVDYSQLNSATPDSVKFIDQYFEEIDEMENYFLHYKHFKLYHEDTLEPGETEDDFFINTIVESEDEGFVRQYRMDEYDVINGSYQSFESHQTMMGIYENQEVYVVLFDLDEGMAYIPLDEYLSKYRLYAEDNRTSQYNRIFRFEDDLPERLAIAEEKYKGLYMEAPIDGDPESYRVLKPSHYYNYVRSVTDDSAIKEDDQWVYLIADEAILEKVDSEFWDVMQLDPSEVNQFVLRVHKESQLIDGKVYFVSQEDPTFVYYISQNHYDFREATADDERPFPNEDQIIGDFEDISLQIEEELGMLPWEVQDMRHYLEIVIYDSEYQSPEFEDAYSEIMYLIDEFNYPETQLDEDLRVLIDDEEFRANVKEYILGE